MIRALILASVLALSCAPVQTIRPTVPAPADTATTSLQKELGPCVGGAMLLIAGMTILMLSRGHN
jgi:hypothetical protein